MTGLNMRDARYAVSAYEPDEAADRCEVVGALPVPPPPLTCQPCYRPTPPRRSLSGSPMPPSLFTSRRPRAPAHQGYASLHLPAAACLVKVAPPPLATAATAPLWPVRLHLHLQPSRAAASSRDDGEARLARPPGARGKSWSASKASQVCEASAAEDEAILVARPPRRSPGPRRRRFVLERIQVHLHRNLSYQC